MDAAERLLAERGSTAMSVRDVLAEAGVANASAAGDYFGSPAGGLGPAGAAPRRRGRRGRGAASCVRAGLAGAGVANASAVGYYFGSKDGLVAAVERRAVEQANAQRAAGRGARGRGGG